MHADYLMRDEWLHSLLGHLPLEAGVVAVVAGRNQPPWAQAQSPRSPDAFVRAWPVGYLTIGDALSYLDKAGAPAAWPGPASVWAGGPRPKRCWTRG
jgi:hypothetical protein